MKTKSKMSNILLKKWQNTLHTVLHKLVAFIKATINYQIILVRGLNGGVYGWTLKFILSYFVAATILTK